MNPIEEHLLVLQLKFLNYKFEEALHPRHEAGSEHGGEFTSKLEASFLSAEDKLRKEGGFSLRPNSLSEEEQYIVALGGFEEQVPLNEFTHVNIRDYHSKFLDKFKSEENLILGGWHNKDNNIVYLDISKAFKSKDEAINFGLMSNQLEGWDAKENKYFDIAKKKDELTKEQRIERLRAMHSNPIHNVPLGKKKS